MKAKEIIACLSLAALMTSCEAKRVEAPVKPVEGATAAAEESKSFSANLDGRLNDLIVQLADFNAKTKAVVRLTQAATNSSGQDYTPLDFMLDVLTEAKQGVAHKTGTDFSKEGMIEMDFLAEGNPCRVVKTIITGTTNPEDKISHADLKVRNACINGGKDVNVAVADWVGDDFTLNIELYDIEKALFTEPTFTILNFELKKQTGCTLAKNTQGKVTNANCQNLVVRYSDSVVSTFDHLSYSGQGETSLIGDGRVFEANQQKASFKFTVPRGGDVKFDIEKTTPAPAGN